MNLELTKWQTEQLEEFFNVASLAHAQGRPGMILAQVIQDAGGEAHMAVMFAGHDMALKMQALSGNTKGKLIEEIATALCPLDSPTAGR